MIHLKWNAIERQKQRTQVQEGRYVHSVQCIGEKAIFFIAKTLAAIYLKKKYTRHSVHCALFFFSFYFSLAPSLCVSVSRALFHPNKLIFPHTHTHTKCVNRGFDRCDCFMQSVCIHFVIVLQKCTQKCLVVITAQKKKSLCQSVYACGKLIDIREKSRQFHQSEFKFFPGNEYYSSVYRIIK